MVTLLWEADADEGDREARDYARKHGIEVIEVSAATLPRMVLPSLVKGGVIVVVSSDASASRALGLGVDEVLRSGQLSKQAVGHAIARAETRAEARVVREALARRTSGDDDAMALRILAAAITHEVNNPLAAAVLDVENLADLIIPLLDATETLAEFAPAEQRKRIEKCLAAAPSEELREIIENIAGSLRRAAIAMHRLSALASNYDSRKATKAAAVATELVEILRASFGATLSVETQGACLVNVPRSTFACVVGALLAHALDAVRLSGLPDRQVVLRVSEEDDGVLIEVEHSGASIPADLRPNVFEPYFRRSEGGVPATGLQGIRERARAWGGEFLVLTEENTTTFRLVVPSASEVSASKTDAATKVRLEDAKD